MPCEHCPCPAHGIGCINEIRKKNCQASTGNAGAIQQILLGSLFAAGRFAPPGTISPPPPSNSSASATSTLSTIAFDAARPPGRKGSNGKIRIGLICPCLVVGGAEAQQLAIARYADPARIEWAGCCVVGDRTDPGMVAATSALMPVSVGPDAARRLAADCDVLITWAVEGIPEMLAGIGSPPKVVSVCHSPLESPWGVRVYARETADRFVAVSELALPVLPPESRAMATVIRNCVDADRLKVERSRFQMRDHWGISRHAPVAGFLGRLSAEKDPLAMVRMAHHLPPDWRVVIVGAGWERLDLVKPPNMTLAGSDPAAGDVLNAFDVLVVPSLYESYGLTLVEGLWMGKPVVSTEVGMAKVVPGLTRPIPVSADGLTLAAAVLEAYRVGPKPVAYAWARANASPERFGREWTELLCSLAPPETPPAVDPGVRDRVLSCPDRGGILPISQQDDCGCRGEGTVRVSGGAGEGGRTSHAGGLPGL